MNNSIAIAEKIKIALAKFASTDYAGAGTNFFDIILGEDLSESHQEEELAVHDLLTRLSDGKYIKDSPAKEKDDKIITEKIKSVYSARVLAVDDLNKIALSHKIKLNNELSLWKQCLFLIVQMKQEKNRKSTYTRLTRILNKRSDSPIIILFCDKASNNSHVSLSLIERRPDKRQQELDVLAQKVTMLYNIKCDAPHRADIDLLSELNLSKIMANLPKDEKYFDEIISKWLNIISIEKLNNNFYKDLYNWFDKAIKDPEVKFPSEYIYYKMEGGKEVPKTKEIKPQEQLIRLVIRFMFVWFIKEKQIVPDILFDKGKIFASDDLLEGTNKDYILKGKYSGKEDNYYRAILQNLFFATLNTPLDEDKDYLSRGFRKKVKAGKPNNPDYRNFNKWRYESEIHNPGMFAEIMNQIPFINGGLFDCLDSFEGVKDKNRPGYRLDCFTENTSQRQCLSVPNKIFFDKYGAENEGLISIFNRYKFTVEENTPLDIDVALDPELLGIVFENLLASYDDKETTKDKKKGKVRKATGSYYTPRHIVHFMVNESLKEYLDKKLNDEKYSVSSKQLDNLLDTSLEEVEEEISTDSTLMMIKAINDLKVLDPAVGSGAFPMEVLNICVKLLTKLDPDNKIWRDEQIKNIPEYKSLQQDQETSSKIMDKNAREDAQTTLSIKKEQIKNDFKNDDYSRKLYLIRNTIFGVDIQPIACQVTRLRFFISLAIEQEKDSNAKDNNYGINPLPNLETNFIAANSIIGDKDILEILDSWDCFQNIHQKILKNRDQIFNVRNRQEKLYLIQEDKELRDRLGDEMIKHFYPDGEERTDDRHKKQREALMQAVYKIQSWNFTDQNVAAQWFQPEVMFNITKGFDMIIGNPPYVRQETFKDDKYKLKIYREDVYHGRADLYTYFYSLGFHLLSSFGNLCFITSNKWHKVDSGRKLREVFRRTMDIKLIFDMKERVFDAGVDTCIVLAVKEYIGSKRQFRYSECIPKSLDSLPEIPYDASGENVFIIKPKEINDIKKQMDRVGIPIAKLKSCRMYRGIKTGSKPAFVISNVIKEVLCKADKKSQEIMAPLIEANQILPYCYTNQKKWLINVHDGYKDADGKEIASINIDEYSAVKKHLDGYKLTDRKAWGKTHYNLVRYSFLDLLFQEKVIWRNINSRFTASLDTEGIFVLDTCSLIYRPGYNKYLVALFNSKLINYYCSLILPGMADSTLEHKPLYLNKLPIVELTKDKVEPYNKLIDTIIEKKKVGESTQSEEYEIDELVYKLYKITDSERKIVEDELNKHQSKKPSYLERSSTMCQ